MPLKSPFKKRSFLKKIKIKLVKKRKIIKSKKKKKKKKMKIPTFCNLIIEAHRNHHFKRGCS
jgi:uncharacterized protein YggL (DUF469 family)